MIRDPYNLKGILYSLAMSAIGAHLEYGSQDSLAIDRLTEVMLNKVYERLEEKRFIITVHKGQFACVECGSKNLMGPDDSKNMACLDCGRLFYFEEMMGG